MKSRSLGGPWACVPAAIFLALAALLFWTGPVASQESCPEPGYATDHILVKMRSDAAAEMLENMKNLNGQGEEQESRGLENLWIVDLPTGLAVPEAVQLYRTAPGVEYAEPDYIAVLDQACPGTEAWIQKSVTDTPDPVAVGERLTYDASVTNLGPDTATNVRMWAFLTDDAEFVSQEFLSDSGGSCGLFDERGLKTACQVDALGVGEKATVRITVRPLEVGRLALIFEAWPENGPGLSFEISEGTEVLPPNPLGCTIFGTQGPNLLHGTQGPDVICGRGGSDYIYGRGGNDVVYGGDDPDDLVGGDGSDVLRGGNGYDEVFGGPGSDRLFGGPARDYLAARDGIEGNDSGRGGAEQDIVVADEGDHVKD